MQHCDRHPLHSNTLQPTSAAPRGHREPLVRAGCTRPPARARPGAPHAAQAAARSSLSLLGRPQPYTCSAWGVGLGWGGPRLEDVIIRREAVDPVLWHRTPPRGQCCTAGDPPGHGSREARGLRHGRMPEAARSGTGRGARLGREACQSAGLLHIQCAAGEREHAQRMRAVAYVLGLQATSRVPRQVARQLAGSGSSGRMRLLCFASILDAA